MKKRLIAIAIIIGSIALIFSGQSLFRSVRNDDRREDHLPSQATPSSAPLHPKALPEAVLNRDSLYLTPQRVGDARIQKGTILIGKVIDRDGNPAATRSLRVTDSPVLILYKLDESAEFPEVHLTRSIDDMNSMRKEENQYRDYEKLKEQLAMLRIVTTARINATGEFEIHLTHETGRYYIVLQVRSERSLGYSLGVPEEIVGRMIDVEGREVDDIGVIRLAKQIKVAETDRSSGSIHGQIFDISANKVDNFIIHYVNAPSVVNTTWEITLGKPEIEHSGNEFTILHALEGHYEFIVTAEGYAPRVVRDIDIREGDNSKEIQVYLDYGARLTGVVRDGDNFLIAGASVTLKSLAGAIRTETDSHGLFSMSNIGQDLSYTLTIEHPGFQAFSREFKTGFFTPNGVPYIECVLSK